jgi:hypothetical protein
VLAYCVWDDRQQDAAVFLGLYLEVLKEELATIHSSISVQKLASTPNVEELGEDTQSHEGQAELGVQGYTVRQFLFLFVLSFMSLMWAWM